MLRKKLLTVLVALSLCSLKASTVVETASGFFNHTKKIIGSAASVAADVLLSRGDDDLLDYSICARPRAGKKPAGMKSHRQTVADADDDDLLGDSICVRARHRPQTDRYPPVHRAAAALETQPYDATTKDDDDRNNINRSSSVGYPHDLSAASAPQDTVKTTAVDAKDDDIFLRKYATPPSTSPVISTRCADDRSGSSSSSVGYPHDLSAASASSTPQHCPQQVISPAFMSIDSSAGSPPPLQLSSSSTPVPKQETDTFTDES